MLADDPEDQVRADPSALALAAADQAVSITGAGAPQGLLEDQQVLAANCPAAMQSCPNIKVATESIAAQWRSFKAQKQKGRNWVRQAA